MNDHHADPQPVTPAQRDALASPIRFEVFSHFSDGASRSVREVAERMGRAPGSLYYHLHRLVDTGLLEEAGVREGGGRPEQLYRARLRAVRLDRTGTPEDRAAVRQTMASAFRMAERDLEAALEVDGRGELADGAILGTRLHFRADPELLERIRGHVEAAMELIRSGAEADATPDTTMYSLTLTLLPLRGRT